MSKLELIEAIGEIKAEKNSRFFERLALDLPDE